MLFFQFKKSQGHRSVISDNVKILDDSLVLPDTVIPPYCIFGGKPGRISLNKVGLRF